MKEISSKQFPTVWSELFLEFENIKGKVDTDQSISFKDIIEWITEYNNLNFNDTMSGNVLDDLTKRGKVLHTFLNTVKEKIKHMHGSEELSFSVWSATTKTNYSGGGTAKDPSEAARDRMLLVDVEYQTRKTVLIRLLVMVETADSLLWDMNGMISHIQAKLEAMRREQPRLP